MPNTKREIISNGFKEYLNDTSLHGLKYLAYRRGIWFQLIWVSLFINFRKNRYLTSNMLKITNYKSITCFCKQAIVIAGFVCYSGKMLYHTFEDWSQNKVLTSIDNVETPLKEVDFPTITICHEPKYEVDNWALPEMILNLAPFEEKTKTYFEPVFNNIFNEVTNAIDNAIFDKDELKQSFLSDLIEHVRQSLLANLTTFEGLETKLRDSYGKLNYEQANVFIRSTIPKSNLTLKCTQNCDEFDEKILRFLFKADALKMGYKQKLGTFLRQHIKHLGFTFDNEDVSDGPPVNGKLRYSKFCKEISQAAQNLHELLIEATNFMNFESNISIYDLPSFFKVNGGYMVDEESRSSYPFYSMCKLFEAEVNMPNKLPSCTKAWNKVLKKSNNSKDHPINSLDSNNYCLKNVQEITGMSLRNIMEVMKHAYHLGNHADLTKIYENIQNNQLLSNDKINFRKSSLVKEKYFNRMYKRSFVVDFNDVLMHPNQIQIHPVITNAGLCYSWNNENLANIFKPTKSMDDFVDVFYNEDVNQSLIQNGALKTMTFVLNKHELYLQDRLHHDLSFR